LFYFEEEDDNELVEGFLSLQAPILETMFCKVTEKRQKTDQQGKKVNTEIRDLQERSEIMKEYINAKEYLRALTKEDVKYIVTLSQAKHKVEGQIGSLDSTHIYWKTFPTAWKCQFRGRHTSPSLVHEAVADNNLWFLC
jgi:hypothetical protein